MQLDEKGKAIPGVPYQEIGDQSNQASNPNIASSRLAQQKAAKAIIDRSMANNGPVNQSFGGKGHARNLPNKLTGKQASSTREERANSKLHNKKQSVQATSARRHQQQEPLPRKFADKVAQLTNLKSKERNYAALAGRSRSKSPGRTSRNEHHSIEDNRVLGTGVSPTLNWASQGHDTDNEEVEPSGQYCTEAKKEEEAHPADVYGNESLAYANRTEVTPKADGARPAGSLSPDVAM